VSLEDPAIVQAGAQAFSARGCVNCHGGPGVKWAKFSEGLHPDPPDLKEIANERAPQHLVTPIMSDGSEVPPIEMRALFEQFHQESRG
jgi:hypothetical protein